MCPYSAGCAARPRRQVAAKDHAEFIKNMELSEFGIDPPDITNWQWPFEGIS